MPVDDSYTVALLHLNLNGVADGGTVIVDESDKAWITVGNAQLDTAQKKFGDASLLLDGTADYIVSQTSPDFEFGTADFTVDGWVRFNVVPAAYDFYTFCGKRQNEGQEGPFWIGVYNSFVPGDNCLLTARLSSDGLGWAVDVKSADLAPGTGVWYHWEMSRSGGTIDAYWNGVNKIHNTTLGTSSLFANTTIGVQVGGNTDDDYTNGWIDEVRISKGIARHTGTASFTPETVPYGFAGGGIAITPNLII